MSGKTALPALPEGAGSFAERLIAWQKRHGRHDLPWQQRPGGERDPYRVWLSEIMLQQTQVATVIPYYRRFLERFPTLAALAAAPQGEVLEHWAGLGYYARARNLHRCAQTLVAEDGGYGGRFPRQPAHIAELPGIGRSTAAAIAVFGFGERAAILDGNVKRVFARCFGIEGFPGSQPVEKRMWAIAEALLPQTDVDAYTQGLMDLGATVCTRANPRCADCPMAAICVARDAARQDELPTPKPRKAVPERCATPLFLDDGESVLLERRPPSGIWGGLLAPPEVSTGGGSVPDAQQIAEAAEALARRHGCRLLSVEALPPLTHAFTHFRLHLSPQRCRVERIASVAAEPGWEWIAWREGSTTVASAALPAPIRKILAEAARQPGLILGRVSEA